MSPESKCIPISKEKPSINSTWRSGLLVIAALGLAGCAEGSWATGYDENIPNSSPAMVPIEPFDEMADCIQDIKTPAIGICEAVLDEQYRVGKAIYVLLPYVEQSVEDCPFKDPMLVANLLVNVGEEPTEENVAAQADRIYCVDNEVADYICGLSMACSQAVTDMIWMRQTEVTKSSNRDIHHEVVHRKILPNDSGAWGELSTIKLNENSCLVVSGKWDGYITKLISSETGELMGVEVNRLDKFNEPLVEMLMLSITGSDLSSSDYLKGVPQENTGVNEIVEHLKDSETRQKTFNFAVEATKNNLFTELGSLLIEQGLYSTEVSPETAGALGYLDILVGMRGFYSSENGIFSFGLAEESGRVNINDLTDAQVQDLCKKGVEATGQ